MKRTLRLMLTAIAALAGGCGGSGSGDDEMAGREMAQGAKAQNLVEPALTEPHAPPVAEVDRGNDDHRAPPFTTAAKFSSSRSPQRWLFSGWNWVA